MNLVISRCGQICCLYDESIDLAALGTLSITRASSVEPDEQGRWWADLGFVDGPLSGPFTVRSQALTAEKDWLEAHWLW